MEVMTVQAILKVPRIHCDGCVNTVTNAVKKLSGVKAVEASEVTKEVKIEFDPAQVTEQKIRQQLSQVGYPATRPPQAFMREPQPDRHAASRERRRRKARYSMRVSGRSVRLLARLLSSGKRTTRKKRPR